MAELIGTATTKKDGLMSSHLVESRFIQTPCYITIKIEKYLQHVFLIASYADGMTNVAFVNLNSYDNNSSYILYPKKRNDKTDLKIYFKDDLYIIPLLYENSNIIVKPLLDNICTIIRNEGTFDTSEAYEIQTIFV